MIPFRKQEWDELVALFAIGASEEDDVVFVTDRHNGGCYAAYEWCYSAGERGLRTEYKEQSAKREEN